MGKALSDWWERYKPREGSEWLAFFFCVALVVGAPPLIAAHVEKLNDLNDRAGRHCQHHDKSWIMNCAKYRPRGECQKDWEYLTCAEHRR